MVDVVLLSPFSQDVIKIVEVLVMRPIERSRWVCFGKSEAGGLYLLLAYGATGRRAVPSTPDLNESLLSGFWARAREAGFDCMRPEKKKEKDR